MVHVQFKIDNMNMKKYKLGDLLSEFHAGKAIQTENVKNKGAYPVYGGNGQRGYTDSYNQDGEYLIIGRQGAYCGNVRYNIGKAYLTEHAIVGQAKENHNPIYIALKLSLMKLSQLQGQSAQPGLSVNTLSCISMEMHPKEIQDKIADIMLKLDRKIELNKQINDNLEAMAKQLYDYWFVQFGFPNEEGKPYKSSGGAMVYNEKLKREIPQGWHCGTLLDIAEYTNGLACQKYRPIDNNKLPVIKIKEMHDGLSADTEWVKADIPDDVKVFDGDVLFSWSASLEVMLWAYGNGGLNQHIFKVTSKNGYPRSFYFYQLIHYVGVFKQMAEARKTTMGHITQDHLRQSTIALPPNVDIANKLEEKLCPIFDEIVKNNQEIMALTKQRDELLPLLMNGQASVNYHLSDD